jgi:hypothetical protein
MLVAMVAVLVRGPDKSNVMSVTSVRSMTTARALLQRIDTSDVSWAQVVGTVFDNLNCRYRNSEIEHLSRTETNLTNMTRRMELPREETLWLLSTLSELRSEWWRPVKEPFLIEMCLAILSDYASKRDDSQRPDMVLLEAVITLAAMSCSPESTSRLHILTSSREHPWLLRNIRNPALFSNWFQNIPPAYRKQLISLLLLVINALICRDSHALAVQYLTVITSNGDFPLYTSALTAIAPAIGDLRLSIISRMLMVPQTQGSIPTVLSPFRCGNRVFQEELLKNYDLQLGASENPDPNVLAIVFILAKHLALNAIEGLKDVNLELKNPWLRLAARVVARLDIPDGSGLPIKLFYDHRVHNMIAALSLLRYSEGMVTQFTEFLLLESFLELRELSISSTALGYYMKTAISYPGPPGPSYCLSAAVSAAFNFILPDHLLWMGWTLLDLFLDGFERLSVEWRRAFAEGFFTLSHRPLLKPRGDAESMSQDSELEKILTWEYFHEEEQKREWTDSEFSGLDWMVMAWSLHLSKQSGRKTEGSGQRNATSRNLSGPVVNEEFVLRALCKLLDAAPPHQIIPIIPKICEFVRWYDDTELPEYHRMISTRIREAARMHVEFQTLHCFHKFHCTWYI